MVYLFLGLDDPDLPKGFDKIGDFIYSSNSAITFLNYFIVPGPNIDKESVEILVDELTYTIDENYNNILTTGPNGEPVYVIFSEEYIG